METDPPAARLEDVALRYPGQPQPSLSGLSLEVRSGRVTGLLGPNGAGKSSTICLIAGLRRPQAGRVEVLGGPAGRLQARCRLGVMLQEGGLPTTARGPEVVKHVAALRGAPETAGPLIQRLGIDALGRTAIRRLSGGERRRVSLACALVGAPRFVVLDEPTAGLDPRGRAIVWEIVRELRGAGVTVLLSTHLIDEAEALSDDIALIAHGRCVLQAPLADVTASGPEGVAFEAIAHLDLVGLVQALPEGCSAREVSPGHYRVDGAADPQVLATITSWCAQHGVMPRSLHTGQTSLEDVYWRLSAEGQDP